MGQLKPIDQPVFPSRVASRNEHSHAGLPSDGHRPFSVDCSGGNRGNGVASAAPGEARNRLVLENLLAGRDPEGASTHAQALLREFGSLSALLNATPEAIDRAVPPTLGAGAIIAAARDFARQALAPAMRGSPVRGDDPGLHRYLQAKLGRLPHERLHVVFADREGGYIADEQIGSGSAESLMAHLGCLFHRAMTLEAAAILLAHNHPSGVAQPSVRDIEETRKVGYVAQTLGIILIDHLIVTAHRVYRMIGEGIA